MPNDVADLRLPSGLEAELTEKGFIDTDKIEYQFSANVQELVKLCQPYGVKPGDIHRAIGRLKTDAELKRATKVKFAWETDAKVLAADGGKVPTWSNVNETTAEVNAEPEPVNETTEGVNAPTETANAGKKKGGRKAQITEVAAVPTVEIGDAETPAATEAATASETFNGSEFKGAGVSGEIVSIEAPPETVAATETPADKAPIVADTTETNSKAEPSQTQPEETQSDSATKTTQPDSSPEASTP